MNVPRGGTRPVCIGAEILNEFELDKSTNAWSIERPIIIELGECRVGTAGLSVRVISGIKSNSRAVG